MEGQRTLNTTRNIANGLVKQVLNIALPFIIRTIMIYYLGAEYQGLSGLFTSILQMLNLAELGFSTAVIFALYKPIAENDTKLICALAGYLKRVYRIVGFVILAVGLALVPFLNVFIKSDVPADINIYILYFIYLFDTVISYLLFAYKSAILTAMQREDVVTKIATACTVSIRVIQILLLILFRNYYVFILVMPIGTLANNICLQFFSKKLFPHIFPQGKVPTEISANLSLQIRALVISKIADTARNSLDNIIISAMIGLTAVTVYDNYLYIYSGIRGFFGVLVNAMMASVGNSLVTESVEKNYDDLNKFTFIFMMITGWSSCCLFCLYQPFIYIWMKGDPAMLLSFGGMTLFCVYFYIINMNNTANLYLHGNGFYWQLRWWYIIEALGNLGLNILLGKYLGINGIIIATIVTLFFFNFLPKIWVVFRDYFTRSPKAFLLKECTYFLVTVVIAAVSGFLCSLVSFSGWLGLIVKLIIVSVVSALLFVVVFYRSRYFKASIELFKSAKARFKV